MARTRTAPKPVSTRQRLVDAAHALIWANSYAHVSVEDICRAAGVQKGSFYHFFPTKIDLTAAALEDHWAIVRGKIDAIFIENKTPHAQLKALCEGILAEQKEALRATGMVCGCPYATVASELSSNNEQMRELTEHMSARFCGYFELLLKNAVAAKLIPLRGLKQRANEMHTYVIGAMLQARLTNRLSHVEKSLHAALSRIAGLDESPAKAALPRQKRQNRTAIRKKR